MKARIYFGVGGLETRKPGEDHDMVADMKELERVLKLRRYPGLRTTSEVFNGENHLTVAPRLITGGLKWVLPPLK